MDELRLILLNIRSCHNVGSIFRTAEGCGIKHIYITGYTPYPHHDKDSRLPHESKKITNSIHKTALGAEENIQFSIHKSIRNAFSKAKRDGFKIVALEQSEKSIYLNKYSPNGKIALVVGNEIDGINDKVLSQCSQALEIPMYGKKESFNVAVSTAIAIYGLMYNAKKYDK